MANLKVSEMQEAFTANPESILYLVQNGEPNKIKVSSLFGKLPDVLLGGSLQLDTLETIVANGNDILDDHVVTALAVDNVDRVFFLSQGTLEEPLANFMLKVVYLKTQYGGRAIIKGGLIPEISNVTLEKTGDSAMFLSTPSGWIYIAGTAVVNRV